MFKAKSVLSISLSALVIAGAMLPIDPLPAQAQTAKKLNCTGCVRSKQLKNNGIKSLDIRNGQVKNADLANNAVNSQKIADGQVQNADLGVGSVTSDKILDGEVAEADLADGAVITAKIADGAVTFGKLGSDVKQLVPPSFELRDKNGQVIGTVLTILTKSAITRVEFKDSFGIPRFVPLWVFQHRIEYEGTLYYGSPGCSESMGIFIESREALSPAFDPFAILLTPGPQPLYVANTEIASMVQVASRASEEDCETFPAEMRLLLSAEKVVDDLSNTFQAPYELVIN